MHRPCLAHAPGDEHEAYGEASGMLLYTAIASVIRGPSSWRRARAAGLRVALPRQRLLAHRRDPESLQLPRLREAQPRALPSLVQTPFQGQKGLGQQGTRAAANDGHCR